MTVANPLVHEWLSYCRGLASVSDIKALVQTGVTTPTDALVRVDVVLARSTLTEDKKRRWNHLREWLRNDCVSC